MNLVISVIGKNSLHKHYEDGNYDIKLIAYEDNPFGVEVTKGNKFELIYDYLKDKELTYDYYLFLDDDILMTSGEIEELFRISALYKTKISHPSVIGYNYHKVLAPNPNTILRYTDWVELQAPCFSKNKLTELIDTFGNSQHGWGLPELWWKRSTTPWGEDLELFAVIDKVKANHTRDYRTDYKQECEDFMRKHKLTVAPKQDLSKIYQPRYSTIIMYSDKDQHFIPECLESVDPMSEIVLVKTINKTAQETFDSGELWYKESEMRNVLKGNNRIYAEYHYRGEFEFAKARNEAKKLATKEWIFSLDADERLVTSQHAVINKAIEKADNGIGYFVIGTVSFMNIKRGDGLPVHELTRQARLFRRELDWKGTIHEQIEQSAKQVGLSGKAIPITIIHTGYDIKPTEYLKKLERNIKAVLRHPEDALNTEFYFKQLIRDASIYNEIKEQTNGTASTVSGSKQMHSSLNNNKRIRRSSFHVD